MSRSFPAAITHSVYGYLLRRGDPRNHIQGIGRGLWGGQTRNNLPRELVLVARQEQVVAEEEEVQVPEEEEVQVPEEEEEVQVPEEEEEVQVPVEEVQVPVEEVQVPVEEVQVPRVVPKGFYKGLFHPFQLVREGIAARAYHDFTTEVTHLVISFFYVGLGDIDNNFKAHGGWPAKLVTAKDGSQYFWSIVVEDEIVKGAFEKGFMGYYPPFELDPSTEEFNYMAMFWSPPGPQSVAATMVFWANEFFRHGVLMKKMWPGGCLAYFRRVLEYGIPIIHSLSQAVQQHIQPGSTHSASNIRALIQGACNQESDIVLTDANRLKEVHFAFEINPNGSLTASSISLGVPETAMVHF